MSGPGLISHTGISLQHALDKLQSLQMASAGQQVQSRGWMDRLCKRLGRITSDGRFVPEIDGFRLLAILIVVLAHIQGEVAQPLRAPYPQWFGVPEGGMRGVLLFFTISGFILALPFARRALAGEGATQRPFSYSRYLLRRVSRLEPPYVLSLLVRLVLITWVLHEDLRALLPHFFASLVYVHNLAFGSMSRVSPPTWSLEVEVQYYLLAPLLAQVFFIRRPLLRRGLLLAAIIALSLLTRSLRLDQPRIALSLAGNFQFFAAGILLCDLYVTRALQQVSEWFWDCQAVVVLLPVLCWRSGAIDVLLPLLCLGLFMGGLRGGRVRRIFAHRLLSTAGGMCYSIYLTHGTVLAVVCTMLRRFVPSVPPAWQAAVVVALSLPAVFVAGAFYFAWVERPCMDPAWPQRLLARIRQGLPGQACTAADKP